MSKTGASKSRILIIDDNPEITRLLVNILGDDHECASADSAEEGLALLHESPFDLVLTDVEMSGLSGIELVPKVLKQTPETVVIMISGRHDIETAINAMQVGAFDYITKPFSLPLVEAAVKRALDHSKLICAKRRYETYLEEIVQLRTKEVKQVLGSLDVAYRSTLRALNSALETRDQDTQGHSERVVAFSLRLGCEMGLNQGELTSLEYGALLHDIGKIGVPDAILRKPAKLTEEEWAQMRLHPQHGKQILDGIEFLEGAALVVLQHHEKWDGSGYPQSLRHYEIDLKARIFAVADAFDAIVSDRVYRKGRSYAVAAVELDGSAGTHFDPQVIEAFHRVSREDWNEMRACSSRADRSKTVTSLTACKPSSDIALLESATILAMTDINMFSKASSAPPGNPVAASAKY